MDLIREDEEGLALTAIDPSRERIGKAERRTPNSALQRGCEPESVGPSVREFHHIRYQIIS